MNPKVLVIIFVCLLIVIYFFVFVFPFLIIGFSISGRTVLPLEESNLMFSYRPRKER